MKTKVFAAAVLLLLAASQGCVSRSMTIRSDPEGADVYLDGKHLGQTPVTVEFRDYGTRGIRLEKEGLQTLKKRIRIVAPWYQRFPFDFVSEMVLPHKFEDKREFSFSLATPAQQKKALLRRANKKRESLR